MSFVSEGRVGLGPHITGFVVQEEMGLEARLRRAYHKAREQAEVLRGRAAGTEMPTAAGASEACAPLAADQDPVPAEAEAGPMPIRRTLSALARQGRAMLRRAADFSRARLPDRERLKDAAALTAMIVTGCVRLILWLPVTLRIAVLGLFLTGVIALWPAATKPPPLRTAMAVEAPTPVAEPAAEPGPAEPANPVRWRSIAAPIASFNLEAPELDRARHSVKARASSDGARQEIHLWASGPDTGRKPFLSGMVAIEQYPRAEAPESHYIDLTRRAALVGSAVERTGEVVGLETKLGEVDTLEARIAPAGADEPVACLAFRQIAATAPFQLHGWFCGSGQLPIDRATLGCLIDRLDLLRAGSDVALRRSFAKAERARKDCGAPRRAVAKPSWIDPDGALPPLKTAISARPARG